MRRRRTSRTVTLALCGTVAFGLAGPLEAATAAPSLPQSVALTSSVSASSRPLVGYGSRGAAVRVVQARLGVRVDGIFGPVTRAAVRRFQARNGLVVDGLVGARTWRTLDSVRSEARTRRTGYTNGRLPSSSLCRIDGAGHERLRCDADRALDRLDRAYRARFGVHLTVNDGYRSYAEQVAVKRKRGRFAATPGTSTHGWGRAVDLGGGVNSFGSRQHTWLRANGPRFGWVHPSWARAGGSLPEPWHWEFAG